MNVIFTDFDGVLCTGHKNSNEDIEKKIILLAGICQRLDCKVVIESAHKDEIDENTLQVINEDYAYAKMILSLMKKYGIEVVGRTPDLISKYRYNKFPREYIEKMINDYKEKYEFYSNNLKYESYEYFLERYPKLSDYLNERMYSTVRIWKEDEIRIYLMRHPEIEHYVVLDDDDLGEERSDLNKIRNHLVLTKYYDFENFDDEGLQPYHEEDIAKILKKENKVRSYVLRMNEKRGKTR